MREMKDSGVEWVGEIPVEWRTARMRFLSKITTGSKDTVDRNDEGAYPFYVRSPKIEKIDSYSFDGEAVLMAGDGVGAGKVFHYVNTKFDFHQRVYCFYEFDKILGKFCYYFLNENFKKEMERGSYKATVDSIRLPMILDFEVTLPDLTTQKKILEYIELKTSEVDRGIAEIEESIERLIEYKKSIITEAVTKGLDKFALMKDSGIEWIGDIPKGWIVSPLKNLGEAIIGLTYSPEDISEEGVLVLRSSNIQQGKLSFEDNVYVTKEIPEKLMVKKEDILICSRNGSKDLIGKSVLIGDDLENSSFGTFMTIFRGEFNKFISYVFLSEIFDYHVESFLTSTVNQLTSGNLNNIKITIPTDKNEQQQIADYLDKKCEKIDSILQDKKNLIAKLKEYKQSLIYEYVTGKKEVPAGGVA
ncbi:MAG: restriction endonuclease subunit S [Defluviitaleaceae bacterium]|nr:restriction endonuclease subunit S [Defluviitaleaceae bacterium]